MSGHLILLQRIVVDRENRRRVAGFHSDNDIRRFVMRDTRMKTLFRRLVHDDRGQDLIEYALLSALIGIVGIVAWTSVGSAIASTYGGWDTGAQGLSATMPDPAGS
jgi:Flp pilus assembly pilin Flp